MCTHRLIPLFALIFLVHGFVAPAACVAADRVAIVVGPKASKLERLAADELADQFKRLFDAETVVTEQVPKEPVPLVLIGNPDTSTAIKRVIGANWPKLSEQGIMLRSFQINDRSGVIVGGETPAAIFWAACELGHRFGVRYLLRGDFDPAVSPSLKLDGFDVELEPALRIRSWELLGESPLGTISWSLDEHRRLLKQLAKLKFNRVTLAVAPWQPVIEEGAADVENATVALWQGGPFPVDGETPGRAAFDGARVFENPDFAGKKNAAELTQAGIDYLRGIIAAAHELGMTVELSLSPLESSGKPLMPEALMALSERYRKTYHELDAVTVKVADAPAASGSVTLLELNSDSAGVLPQSSLKRIEAAVAGLHREQQEGFLVRCRVVGELDPVIHYLSRAAYDPTTRPRAAHDDLFVAVTGKQDIADRLWRAMEHLEQATALIDEKERGFAQSAEGMLLKHSQPQPVPDWWKEALDHYTQSMIELYRSHGAAHPRSRPLLYHYAKRGEFALGYMNAVRGVREAANLRQEKKTEEAIAELEAAVEALHDGVNTLGDIAADPSDRGLIAVLAKFAYRPLTAEYERLADTAESE